MLPLYTTPPTSVQELGTRVITILEQGWCQGKAAVTPNGSEVRPTSSAAVACCLWGAWQRALTIEYITTPLPARTIAISDLLWHHLESLQGRLDLYNDTPGRTAAEVIALVRLAMAAL